MRHFLRALIPLLGWVVLWPLNPALAQTCSQTSTFDYTTTAAVGTRQGTGTSSTAGSANTYTDAVLATSYTFNNYKKLGAGATNNFLVGNNSNLNASTTVKTLYWQVSYDPATTLANNESDVTLTFNRAVSGLVLKLEDLDLATVTPSTWRDEVTFNAYTTLDASGNPTGTPIALSAANFVNGVANQYVSGNTVNGKANSAADAADGNLTVNFPFGQAIRAVTLIYKNTQTLAASNGNNRLQIVGLNSVSWCAQADLTTTLAAAATPVTAGTNAQFNVTFANTGELAIAGNTTAYVQLPSGLTNVAATNGGVYNPANFRVEYPVGTAKAANSTFSSVITFTAPNTGPVAASSSITSATSETPNEDPNTANASIAVTPIVLSGRVYEDANYGGGSGRAYAAAAGYSLRPGVLVELYNNANAYLGSTITDASGNYSFNVPSAATYKVRVLNSSVTSGRPGATFTTVAGGYRVSTEAAVQTYNGTTTRVGGEGPAKTDAAANTGAQTLTALTPGGGTTTPESLATIAVTAAGIANQDFGFNFDLVVNTNDTGQGSLRQFILNSNALGGETALAQSGSNTAGTLPAAKETSIFMIPDNAAHNGQLAGLGNALTSGVAVITPATALPAITGPATAIDGSTQTTNIGNTNNVTLGVGGTVGTGATALGQLNGPEVQITGNSSIASGLDFTSTATDGAVRGLAIYGFTPAGGYPYNQPAETNANIRIAANNVSVSGTVVGTSATSFTDPGVATRTNLNNISVTGGTGTVISNSLIGFSNSRGIYTLPFSTTSGSAGSTLVTVSNNEIRSNGLVNTNLDGIDIQGANSTVTGNLLIANGGNGIDSYLSTGGNTLSGNTITGNGVGSTTNAVAESPGIRIYGAGNTVNQNVITNNYGAGILVTAGATTTTISQNSILNNGTVTAANGAAASGEIGIDLQSATDNNNIGTAPYVTLNDGTTTTGTGNSQLDFPVLQTANVINNNLVINGISRPGVTIEFFLRDGTTGNFGQGQTYLGSGVENGTGDTNTATATLNYSGLINGLNQGSDNTNSARGFTISVPIGSLTAAQRTALLANGLTATATQTGVGTSEFSGRVVPIIPADLATTVTGPATVAAGQPSGTYTATFSNLGPNSTTGATRSVAVPTGSTFTAAQTAAITAQGGTVSGTTITFPVSGALAPSATTSFTFAFTAPTTTGAVTVVSTVGTGSGTTDPNTANNTSTLNLTVTPVSDLVATITGNGPVAVGSAGTFTATFTNNGPNGPATGTSATVQLPAGLGTVTFTGTTAGVTPSYNNTTGVVSFTGTPLTSLATGAGVATTINYTQPTTGSGVTATAAIATTSNQAGQTSNDTQTATNAATVSADVATSILGPTSLTLGGQATYNVLTTNNGPNTATNVVQTVTLPAGATNVFITGGGVLSGSTVTFPAISLANGQTVNNTVSFTAPGAALSSYNTVANVTATQDAATTGNNTATTPTSITAPAGTNADLNVTLTTSAASAVPNTVVTFTLKQANDGVGTGAGVVSTLNLPAGLTTTTLTLPGVTGTLLGNVITFAGGATLYNTASYNTLTGVLTFPTVATQAPGAATTNTYLVSVTTPASGVVAATGAVRGTSPDNEPGNNVASAQTTVNTNNSTDLATTLTGPNSATPGQSVRYTVTTTNNGPQPATNVVQTVSIPAGLPITGPNAVTIGGAAPTSTSGGIATYAGGVTYNSNTGVVTYPTIATLPNGGTQSSVITYVAPANNGTTVANTAAVSGNGTDPTLTNNAATVLTALTPSADVQVTISGPASAIQGNPVTYGVTTTNNGSSLAASVVTTVQLPTGLTGVVVRDAAGNILTNSATTGYSSADGIVRFPTLTSQAPGATGAASGTITLLAPAASNGPLVPVATVASTTADPNAGNNSAPAVTSVQPATTIVADLSTNLTSSVTSQVPGSPVTFNVTTASANTSTGTATGVVQTVQLPAGLTTNGGTVTVSNSGIYNNATGVVTFPAITLAPGASVPNTIVVSQAPGVDPLVAVATVGGDQTDPSTGNNPFVLNVPITASPDIATSVTGPASASPGQTVSYTVVTSNVGTTPARNATQTLSIPAGVTSYSLNGGTAIPVTGPATITIPVPSTIYPGTTNGVTNTVTFTAPAAGNLPYTVTGFATATGDAGTTGNNTSAQTTSAAAAGPVAANVVNSKNGASPMANDAATARSISPLSATGGTGTLRYTVTSLPSTTQGILYLADGVTPVTAGTLLAAGAEATLTFKPAAGFVGNATFPYTATDNNGTGRTSNTATFLIPVNGDLPSVYYTNASKGGATPYNNGNEIARVFDLNGGIATDLTYTNPDPTTTANGTGNGNATKVPDNGLRSAVTTGVFSTTPYPGVINNLSDLGLVFNATTGQLVVGPSAAELAKLARRQGTYTFSVTTTDIYGGVTTQNVTFTLGNFPLPVELTDFTATAVKNLDAALLWHTAQEKNNDHFEVERSLNGTDYSKIGLVKGQGSKTTPTEYLLTDAGIGPKAKGLVYYRLKQVDTNGETSYSPVRTVTFTAASALASAIVLFPNPATVGTQLDLTQLPTGRYQVSVLDATGRIVLNTTLDAGLAHALDLNPIASGTYNVLVRGQSNGQPITLTKRLIKQ